MCSLPEEAWPTTDSQTVAHAIRSLISDCREIEVGNVIEEITRLGLVPDIWPLVAFLRELMTSCTPFVDTESASARLRADYARRRVVEAAETARMIAADPSVTQEELRIILADLTGSVNLPDAAATLTPSDVLNAPEPSAPIFGGGPVRGTLAELVSESGRSKSYQALTWAISVACGETVQQSFTPADSGPVLFVSYEDSPAVMRYRVNRIADLVPGLGDAAHEAIRAGRLQFYTDLSGPLFQTEAYGTTAPTDLYRELEKVVSQTRPVLVVIDPLSGAASLRDENSNSEVGIVAAHLANLAQRHNTVVLLVHHSSKAGAAGASQHSARGASSLACRARWIAQITPPKATPDGNSDKLELTVVKDSYHKLLSPVILVRVDGGALREDSGTRDPLTVAETIRAWLENHSTIKLSLYNVVSRRASGRDLADHVGKIHSWVGGNVLHEVLISGIRAGILSESTIREGGRDRTFLVPGTPLSESEDFQDDNVPF